MCPRELDNLEEDAGADDVLRREQVENGRQGVQGQAGAVDGRIDGDLGEVGAKSLQVLLRVGGLQNEVDHEV
ncbi:hypothetical protein VCV18_003026 [Metarhizium anisopliae]